MPVMEQQVVGTAYTYNGVEVIIGSPLSHAQMNVLPVGSVFNANPDPHQVTRLMTKEADGRWVAEGNRHFRAEEFRQNHNLLYAVPEGVVTRQETIDEYRTRFRAKVIKAAETHLGRNDRTVFEVLDRLGVPGGGAVEGAVVNVAATPIPEGTTVMVADPGDPGYHVFVRHGDGWMRIYGMDYDEPPGNVTVIEEPEATMRTEPNDNDAAAIAAFKAAAWDEGWKIKRNRGWCGAYEQIMAEVGLTYGDALPDFMGFEETLHWRDLPQGAVLVYQGSARWDMAVRDDNGEFGLRRVAGTSTGRLGRARWRVFFNGEGQMRVNATARVFAHMPPGSRMEYHGTTYTRDENGMWVSTDGHYHYRDGDFGNVDVQIVGVS